MATSSIIRNKGHTITNQTNLNNIQNNFSLLSNASEIRGDLFISSDTFLNNKIEGKVIGRKECKLTLEKDALLIGTIHCHSVDIYGEVQGTIEAKGQVILRPGSNVTGAINCQDLIIKPGALVNIKGQTFSDD